MTWALILAAARHLVTERQAVADGRWQTTVGRELDRRVLGVLGLGRIGGRVARIGAAFGMDVVAWSENLTVAAPQVAGARYLPRDEFFAAADVVSIHLKLGERSRGLVGAAELSSMKSTALLVNMSREPIVDTEPLPADHPLRTWANVLATPHIGYAADRPYRIFFRDAVAAIADWLDRT